MRLGKDLLNIFIEEVEELQMSNKDKIEICAWIAVAVGTFISIIALVISISAFHQQKEALQVSVFNELTNRMDDLHDNLIANRDKVDKATLMYFNLNMLNVSNQFAFYANRGYLRPDMVNARTLFVLETCEHVAKAWPEIIKLQTLHLFGTEEREKVFYANLGVFYERVTGKKFPLWEKVQSIP